MWGYFSIYVIIAEIGLPWLMSNRLRQGTSRWRLLSPSRCSMVAWRSVTKVSFAESVLAGFVGGAVDVAALEAGARHPDRAAIG